jgi:ubiquinone/menaquinone biosynthesis C-methylase UbiE
MEDKKKMGKNSKGFEERDLENHGDDLESRDLKSINKMLSYVKKKVIDKTKEMDKMLDVGCGYGALTRFVGGVLNIRELHGIDIDQERLSISERRRIVTHKVDLNTQAFPFLGMYFDLVTSFNVLEQLISYDNVLMETHRVLKKDGLFILSLPNLGSYVNRGALLFGYQPRDIEISQVTTPGILPMVKKGCIYNLHNATLRAMKELLTFYNFDIILTKPLMPIIDERYRTTRNTYGKIISAIDQTIGRIPSMSREFIILSRKK